MRRRKQIPDCLGCTKGQFGITGPVLSAEPTQPSRAKFLKFIHVLFLRTGVPCHFTLKCHCATKVVRDLFAAFNQRLEFPSRIHQGVDRVYLIQMGLPFRTMVR